MKGLYIRKPLSKDLEKYAKPKEMKDMLKNFKNRIGVKAIDAAVYQQMEELNCPPPTPGTPDLASDHPPC